MVSNNTRKERDEIERLTKEMAKMQTEHNTDKGKNKMQMDRLKKQNEDLVKKNKDLQEEVKMLEQARIQL